MLASLQSSLRLVLLLCCVLQISSDSSGSLFSGDSESSDSTQSKEIFDGHSDKADWEEVFSKVGDIVTATTAQIDQWRHMHELKLNPSNGGKYLFFDLKIDPIIPSAAMSMYYNDNDNRKLKECHVDRADSCYLSAADFKDAGYLTIFVDCGQKCSYSFRSYWSNLQHLRPGDNLRFTFAKRQQKQLYHLELNNYVFKQLRILLIPETRKNPFEKIKIYGKYGLDSSPSSQDYDFQSNHLWEDAEGVYLSFDQLRDKQINVLIVGVVETVYTLNCTLVNKTHDDVQINGVIHEYLETKRSNVYHIRFTETDGSYKYPEYLLRLSIYSGTLDFAYYKDDLLLEKYLNTEEGYGLMSDSELKFYQQNLEVNLPKGLYINIAAQTAATFSIRLEGRERDSPIKLFQHVTEFLPVETKHQAIAFIMYQAYGEEKIIDDISFSISLLVIGGDVSVEFRSCLIEGLDCEKEPVGRGTAVLKEDKFTRIGNKQSYHFTLPKDFLQSQNPVQKKGKIMIILNCRTQINSLVGLEYHVDSRTTFLRQNKPVEVVAFPNETKYFKYLNEDPDVTEIRIHVNQISGVIDVGSIHVENPSTVPDPEKNPFISFKKDLHIPIVIVVSSRQESIYSLTLQVISTNQNEVSSMTLTEGVQFEMNLPPGAAEVFSLHPLLSDIHYDYKASGPIDVCLLNEKKQCHQESHHKFKREGRVSISNFTKRSTSLRIENPGKKTVKITMIYKSYIGSECDMKKVNGQYHQTFPTKRCVKFDLSKKIDFELVLSREDLGEINFQFMLCDNLINHQVNEENNQQRYSFLTQQIQTQCHNSTSTTFMFMITNTKLTQAMSITLTYSLVYAEGSTLLLNGLSYRDQAETTQLSLKTFRYEMLDKIDTTIVLRSEMKAEFVAKIIEAGTEHDTEISSTNFQFKAKRKLLFVYFDPYLVITEEDIKKNKCVKCILLIAVISMEEPGSQVQFSIEVTQGNHVLQEGTSSKGFLEKGSVDYFEYTCRRNGSLFIDVSDNGRHCTKLYLSNTDVPGDTNNIVKEIGNELSYECYENRLYFIGVEAITTCPFSIAVTNTKSRITRIERGSTSNLQMDAGQIRLFIIRHISEKPFKLLSLHQYGLVEIYINKSSMAEVEAIADSEKVNVSNFQMKGQLKNRLSVDQHSSVLCTNCYYIVAVEAIKNTDSSLYYGDDDTIMPFTRKVVNDMLRTGQTIKGSFYGEAKLKFELKVHSGSLKAVMKRGNTIFKKIYNSSESLYIENLEFPTDPNSNFLLNLDFLFESSPVHIEFTGMKGVTAYSARISDVETDESSEESEKSANYLEPGETHSTTLKPGAELCVNGMFRDKEERILIMANTRQNLHSKVISVNGKLGPDVKKVVNETIKNAMVLYFENQNSFVFSEAQKYVICLKMIAGSEFTINFLQSEEFNLLAADTQALISHTNFTFVVHSQAEVLVDLFQCEGPALMVYSDERETLAKTSMKPLDLLGMTDQAHAIRINKYETTFVQISAPLAKVRWFPLDQDTDRGLGYLKYRVSTIKYDVGFNRIDVVWAALKQTEPTKNRILRIEYRIYVSSSVQHIHSAQQCERFSVKDVLEFKIVESKENEIKFEENLIYSLKKSDLTDKFPVNENLFIGVVADMTLQLNVDSTLEDYHYIYPTQELPSSIFLATQIEAMDYTSLILLLVCAVIALLIFTFVCTRKIVPMIARLRNSVLIEESPFQDKVIENQGHMEVPMSSDRQGINPIDPIIGTVETEDKMVEEH